MKNNRPLLSAISLVLPLLVACSTVVAQEFLPYEGKNTVQEGEGGTKKVVDGVDFWADGAPPRTFKLLGYITDRRHKTGLVGWIRMSSLDSDVAKLAKENGGDAVILVASEAETVGTVGSSYGSARGNANTVGGNTTMHATGWSTGSSAAVQKQQSKYAVVKYVEREKAVESKPQTPPSGEMKPVDDAKPSPTPAQPSSD